MSKWITKLFYSALLFFILAGTLIYFLLATTQGLAVIVRLSQWIIPGTIQVHGLNGRLWDSFSIERLDFKDTTINIEAHQIRADLQLSDVLNSRILINALTAKTVKIKSGQFTQLLKNIQLKGLINQTEISLKPLTFQIDKENVTAQLQINATYPYRLTAKVQLNPLILNSNQTQAKITIKGDIDHLQWAGSFHHGIELTFQGTLKEKKILNQEINWKQIEWPMDKKQLIYSQGGRLQIKSTLSAKGVTSQLTLNQSSLTIPDLGLKADAIELKAQFKKNAWQATGFIKNGNNRLFIKGKNELNSLLKAQISVKGVAFPFIKTEEYQVNVSPDIKLNLTPSSLHLTGTVLIPYARLKPQVTNNSMTLSDDVVFKKNTTPKKLAFTTSMRLRVETGNEVEVEFKGLHAVLSGGVNLEERPQGPITATGELSVKKGEYKAYGQDLVIEQGRLLFTGGPLDNPGLNLKASKSFDNNASTTAGSNQLFEFDTSNLQQVNLGSKIRVGVEVSGRLSAPKIILFSNPALLSQADILSMLLLGRPVNQANKAGGQLLLAAISSMNLGGGSKGAQLLDQIKQNLGLDFNVQTNSNYNQTTKQVTDSTAFVVSKTLSKRLSLIYNVGLSQADPNVLTMKYLLNKFFSIQVSTSTTGSGADLLYSWSKDKKNASK